MKRSINRLFKAFSFYLPEVARVKPWSLVRIVVHTLLLAISPFVNILIPKWIIDELLGLKRIEILIVFATLLVGLNFLFGSIKEALKCEIENDCDLLRNHFTRKIALKGLDLDFPSIEDPTILDHKERAYNGLDYTGGFEGFADTIKSIVSSALVLLGVSLIVLMNAPWLGLIVFASVIISTFFHGKIGETGRKYFLKLTTVNRWFGYIFFDLADFRYGKDIRMYNASSFITNKGEIQRKKMFSIWQDEASEKIAWSLPEIVLNGLLGIAQYVYVGMMALAQTISIGTFTMLWTSVNELSTSLTTLIHRFVDLKIHGEMLEETINYLAIPTTMENGQLPVPQETKYVFELRDVSFNYPRGEKPVLQHLNLTITPGERLSIVGLNGEGKTTLIKLLTRLYDVSEGEILLNGVNIKNYDRASYHALFSVVFQDFQLLAFSIRENIWGSSDTTNAIEILAQAGIDKMVEQLPHGLDTAVTKSFDEEGFQPSTGEAQKIALARALAKNAPIIVLDEPTASLDPRAEAELYERFDLLIQKKTAIYISHRLSSCLFADRIVLLHEGEVHEEGTHDDLMQMKGRYHDMFSLQAMHYVDAK